MRSRRARDRMHLNAEINVVSLIDVMMLLLVIFMLTAPMMTGGLEIDLPEIASVPIDASGGLNVSIDRGGAIRIDDIAMPYDQFAVSFKSRWDRSAEKVVRLHIDKAVTWEAHSKVLAVIHGAGAKDISYVTDQLEQPAR